MFSEAVYFGLPYVEAELKCETGLGSALHKLLVVLMPKHKDTPQSFV